MKDESTAVKLYKNIEQQWVDAKGDEVLQEELEHRMAVVWRLFTEEEKKSMLTEAKNELMRRFTVEFPKDLGGCCGGGCGCNEGYPQDILDKIEEPPNED